MDHPVEDFPRPPLPLDRVRVSPAFRLAFLSACLTGFITHLYLFSNLLVNHDSMHAVFNNNDTLSTGRWSSRLLSCFSTDFQLPVVIGLISLLALAAAAGFTVRVLGLRDRSCIVLCSALLVTSPITSGIFSYLFTADAYFLALLLNALAVYCAKEYRRGWIAAIALMAVACGTYQAFLCYGLGLFLLDCLFMLLEDVPVDRVIRKGIGYVGISAAALLLYYALLRLFLALSHTALLYYQGMGEISPGSIFRCLPHIPLAYSTFFGSVTAPLYLTPLHRFLQSLTCLLGLGLCAGLILLKRLYRDPPRLLLILAGLALLPLALNLTAVLNRGLNVHQLMVYSSVLVFLAIVRLAELTARALLRRERRGWRSILLISTALSALLVWCGFCANNVSYLRLQLRYENSFAIANRIAARVEALEGYTGDTPVAFFGQLPSDLYGKTVPQLSVPYPITGTEDTPLLSSYSPRDFLKYYIGMHTPPASYARWDAIRTSEFLRNMPCWPSQGSVALYDGIAVVKLGEI